MNRLRSEFHRQETPQGVLTWIVTIDPTSTGRSRCGRPRQFELDGEPLTVSEGRSLKLQYEILD
jgi:hypothetical protein